MKKVNFKNTNTGTKYYPSGTKKYVSYHCVRHSGTVTAYHTEQAFVDGFKVGAQIVADELVYHDIVCT